MIKTILLGMALVLGGCAVTVRESGTVPDGVEVATYTTDQLVTIRGVVTIPESTNATLVIVSVRYANGALAIRMTPDERGVYQTTRLFPDETYTVSAEFALGRNGPWHYPSRVVEATDGGVYRVDFTPYDGDATLHVAADTGTQPYLLALYPQGTPVPEGRGEFQKWFDEGKGHRTPVYMHLGEGGTEWQAETLPGGRYLVVAMANDWQPGDPSAKPVSCEIELLPGRVTSLHLGARCTELGVR